MYTDLDCMDYFIAILCYFTLYMYTYILICNVCILM